MQATMQGVQALRQLRFELQEDSGDAFPKDVITQLLLLYDVCRCLELNLFRSRHVLGDIGWQYVTEYIQRPTPVMIDRHVVQFVDGEFTVVE